MTFARRRNRQTTHFSEHIPVVERRKTVLGSWETSPDNCCPKTIPFRKQNHTKVRRYYPQSTANNNESTATVKCPFQCPLVRTHSNCLLRTANQTGACRRDAATFIFQDQSGIQALLNYSTTFVSWYVKLRAGPTNLAPHSNRNSLNFWRDNVFGFAGLLGVWLGKDDVTA
jgi:hypothetical protein